MEHLLTFNFTLHYFDGQRMHVTYWDVDTTSEVIPTTFNAMTTRRNRCPPQPLRLFTTDKHTSK